jgi:O-antigen biosynthesis protein
VIRPEISIIIVNYNVRDLLIDCIDSVLKSLNNFTSEIIVVDNASTDDSIEAIKRIYPQVKLIISKENHGFAKANNIALKQAEGKFILFLNPDTLLSERTITVCIDYFLKNSSASIIGCKILNADGTLQVACRRSFPTPWNAFAKLSGLSKLFPQSRIFGKYNVTYLNPDETYRVEAISGAFMFFRREVYDDIGGLDESFFMYGEDLDWVFRASKRGWKTFYVPFTQILHYKGESTRRSNINASDNFYGAMNLFVNKHYHSPSLIFILRLGIFFKRSLSFFTDRISNLKNKKEKHNPRTIVVGYPGKDNDRFTSGLNKNGFFLGILIPSLDKGNKHDSDYPVIGRIEDLDLIVETYRVERVLFSPVSLSYREIIDTIVKSKSKHVTFGLVPRY